MSEEVATKPEETKKPKKKLSLLKKVVIGVVAFFVIIIGLAYFGTREAVKVADQFVGHIQNVSPDSAYELFSNDAKDVVPQDEFAELVEQIGPILNGDLNIIGRSISDGTSQETASRITYKIPGSDGETYVMEVYLVKENDAWKVNSFENLTQENYDKKEANE